MDQSHHARGEKRKTSNSRATVLGKKPRRIRREGLSPYANGIDVWFDVSIFGDIKNVDVHQSLLRIFEGKLTNTR